MNTALYNTEPQTLEAPVTRWADRTQEAIKRVVDSLQMWSERTRQRRHLRDLDERLLADIGLSEADVARELRKPFWRP